MIIFFPLSILKVIHSTQNGTMKSHLELFKLFLHSSLPKLTDKIVLKLLAQMAIDNSGVVN